MEQHGTYPSRETGAPGRRVLALASWRSGDRETRALLGELKELAPCAFDVVNLDSPTSVHLRKSSRTLFSRIRLYDAVVVVFPSRDGAASAALQAPEESLPFGRHFLRRIPAVYLCGDGPGDGGLRDAAEAHARAWRLACIYGPGSDAAAAAEALSKAIF